MLIEEPREALESFRYLILELYSADRFIIVQSALNSYYKHHDSKHLSFHKYTINTHRPYFHHLWAKLKRSLFM